MSEDLATEALLDYLNAVEAGIAAAKQRIKERKGVTEGQKPALDSSKLEALPWKPYKPGHRAGWIFADLPEAKELLNAIKTQPNDKLSLGEFDFKVTHGTDRDFISRYPKK
jgi:hypothetical protein